MPAPVPLELLVNLEKVVARFPDGATFDQIAQNMAPPPSERTLSRWLSILVERRRIQRVGSTRAIRYRALRKADGPTANARACALPLSAAQPANDPITAPSAAIAAQRESRPPAGVAACSPMPGADLTEQIFAAAIGDIVRFKMSRATAAVVLQRMTELNIASVDDRRACLAVLKARLNAFTEAESERYGLEPEQYRAWSAQDRGVSTPTAHVVDAANGGSSGPALPGTGEVVRGAEVGRDRWARHDENAAAKGEMRASQSTTGAIAAGCGDLVPRQAAKAEGAASERADDENVATNGGSSGPALPGTGKVVRGAEVGRDRWARHDENAAAKGGMRAPQSTTGAIAAGCEDLVLRPAAKAEGAASERADGKNVATNGGSTSPALPGTEPVSGIQQTAADMKRLMTPGRMAVSALWAGGVSTAATHWVGGGAGQAVTFLMAGVPPLLFIDRDRAAANNPMDLRAKLTTLVAGGSGGMVCAAPVSYILESALALFR